MNAKQKLLNYLFYYILHSYKNKTKHNKQFQES